MAVVFIHGVNTRDSDVNYQQGVGARQLLFERLVANTLPRDKYPSFSVIDDIYWGDLGVQFVWDLQTVPKTRLLESLGTDDETAFPNPELALTLARAASAREAAPVGEGGVETLGAEDSELLARTAASNPAEVVRAVFAPEAQRFDINVPAAEGRDLSEDDRDLAKSQGRALGLMLLAADQLASEVESAPQLIAGATDAEVLAKITDGTKARYERLADGERTGGPSTDESLGFDETARWVGRRLADLVNGAKAAVRGTRDAIKGAGAKTARGASLILLQSLRDSASQKGLRFLGDVFVYLRRGHPPDGKIDERVREGLRRAGAHKNPGGTREPLVLVTHSFGSIIAYDLLTSGELGDLAIDLWVTVGAQTSLFAEMRLYGSSPPDVPSTAHRTLDKPAQVTRWLNFYDAADVLSYLHEPVFGSDAVTDIEVHEGANVTNAHGHYFIVPSFYRRIGQELRTLYEKGRLP